MSVKDQVAIVTGGASGMGAAIVETLAANGAKVVIADLDLEAAEELVEKLKQAGGSALAVETDVSDQAALEKMFKQTVNEFGTLDILINNAGIMDGREAIHDVTDDLWEKVMATNLNSVFYTSRLALDIFLEKGSGVILNIASVAGLHGARGGAAYTAAKHATIGLTRNTAYMYAEKGIRANAIAPGTIDTGILDSDSSDDANDFGEERQDLGKGTNPRSGDPEEIAKAVLFLVSDDASFINGDVLVVDGGWTSY